MDERHDDIEFDGVVRELEAAGLLAVATDAEGHATWVLTTMGALVARQMAMSIEYDAAALLDVLLEASGRRSMATDALVPAGHGWGRVPGPR